MRVSHFLCCSCRFQSTPPARGGDAVAAAIAALRNISIHAPREGGDRLTRAACPGLWTFQSTPPARGGRPAGRMVEWFREHISIHAPREGGDGASGCRHWPGPMHFNPRPPRGGRRRCTAMIRCRPAFQSTPPARGATPLRTRSRRGTTNFNSRPPRGGRLWHKFTRSNEHTYHFNPRPPRGGATIFQNVLVF